MYTLVFWNQDIGILNANNNINIEETEKSRVIDMIRNHDTDYMANPEVPMLFSNATNWKGKPFMPLSDFVLKTKQMPDFREQATEMAKEQLEITSFEQQTPPLSEEKLAEAEAFITSKIEELKQAYKEKALDEFLDIDPRQYLRYGKTLFINREKVTDPADTFVLPIFI